MLETFLTALAAQLPVVVGLIVWYVKDRRKQIVEQARRIAAGENTILDRFIGHLEKGADVTVAFGKRFDAIDDKLDAVIRNQESAARANAKRARAA